MEYWGGLSCDDRVRVKYNVELERCKTDNLILVGKVKLVMLLTLIRERGERERERQREGERLERQKER